MSYSKRSINQLCQLMMLVAVLLAGVVPHAYAAKCPNCMRNSQGRFMCRGTINGAGRCRMFGCNRSNWFEDGVTDEAIKKAKRCAKDESLCYVPDDEPTDYWYDGIDERYEYEDGSPVLRFQEDETPAEEEEVSECDGLRSCRRGCGRSGQCCYQGRVLRCIS